MAESARSVCAKGKEWVWKGLGLARTLRLRVPLGRIVGLVLVSLPQRGLEIRDIVSLFCEEGNDFADGHILSAILSLNTGEG
jgi:hypothetical protein